MIKLIALDLDGTLLKDNHQMDLQTLQLLKSLNDVKLTISTGRCFSFIKDFISDYNLQDFDLILNNGHEFISADKKIHSFHDFNYQNLQNVVEILLKNNFSFMMYSANGNKYTFCELDDLFDTHINIYSNLHGNLDQLSNAILFSKKHYLDNTFKVNNIQDLNDLNILKIDAINPNIISSENGLLQLQNLDCIDISHSYGIFVEVCQNDINKGIMVKNLGEKYNISLDEIAVFGDGSNDINMLSLAKYSFAMGNASDNVKSFAKYITKTNEQQGIIHGLNQLKDLGLLNF